MGAETSCEFCNESSLGGCSKPECKVLRYLDNAATLLRQMEDVTHGSLGEQVTEARSAVDNAVHELENIKRYRK